MEISKEKSRAERKRPEFHGKFLPFEELTTLRQRLPLKKTIVHCHGVFDVLHAGHLAYFESAKKFGDVLVVTVTTDRHVNKGPGRPYFNATIRAKMVAALEIVDFVAVSDFASAVPCIEALKPDFYVKGPDYKRKETDPTGAIYHEEAAVQKFGGKMAFTEDDTFSASALINKFFSPWTDDQLKVIHQVKQAGGVELIQEILNKASQESVCIIGEPIVDTYVFCTPEGISSKSPSISAKFRYEENYLGGSLAIANHLSDFVKDVVVITTHGNEAYFQDLLKEKLDSRVRMIAKELPDVPTPRKTRFITAEKSQRIFELTNLRSDQWFSSAYESAPREFCETLKSQCAKASVTLVADFGHGLLENAVLDTVSDLGGFIGLNVQTNSSNFGFNPFTKHKNFSYLCIDMKEAQIAFHDRFSPHKDLLLRIRKRFNATQNVELAMTLGSIGSYYCPRGEEAHLVPAFADQVVDATGAGDAYFGLTSVLVRVIQQPPFQKCPPVVVPFLGNIFAGLKTKIMGNKSSVSCAQLIKAVSSILK